MRDETRRKISASQRARYEREAADKARFRNDLHSFALWLSPTWDPENLDDVEAALRAVDTFIAAGCPPPESSQG